MIVTQTSGKTGPRVVAVGVGKRGSRGPVGEGVMSHPPSQAVETLSLRRAQQRGWTSYEPLVGMEGWWWEVGAGDGSRMHGDGSLSFPGA